MTEPATTPYAPDWDSLRTHRIPEWFADAKFGIWAHWGPQSVARSGDWYARHLYGRQAASAAWEIKRPARQYAHHRARWGSPAEHGYKDLLPLWRAERFDPEELVELYRASGARYLMAMAVHCDNFALWDSAEQPWNAARIGPRRDVVAGWERAARGAGLPFGLSFHNNWTWNWLDVAHGTDPEDGRPLDGRLTAADGAGTWWEGLDPHQLYPPPHAPGAPASRAWVERFWRMTREAVTRFAPDTVYFDDRRPPFEAGAEHEVDADALDGRAFLAEYYTAASAARGGMVTVKSVPEIDRGALVLDAERRLLEGGQSHPWQFDTSDGEWFVCDDEDPMFHPRKSARELVTTLVDVVSANGTMLLNIPQNPDGTIDAHSRSLLGEIGAWLAVCGDGIYGTRPWRVAAEGPTGLGPSRGVNEVSSMNEGERAFTAADVRYTSRGDEVFAALLGWPVDGRGLLRSWSPADGTPLGVELLGWGGVEHEVTPDGLAVRLPAERPTAHVGMLRIVR